MSRLLGAGRRCRVRPTGDRGSGLAELLVSASILAVVLPIAGSLLQHALFAQRDVTAVTSASNAAQAVVMSVEAGVHNASAIAPLATFPSSAPFPHEMLVVRSRSAAAGATPAWTCQAWYYDAETRTVYARQETIPATTPATPLIARPTAPTFTGWTEIARGVTPRARTAATPPVLGAPLPTVFTSHPSGLDRAARVEVGLQVEARAGKPVVLTTTITKHPQNDARTQPCF